MPRALRVAVLAALTAALAAGLAGPWLPGALSQDLAGAPGAEKGRKAVVTVAPADALLPQTLTVTGAGFEPKTGGTIQLSPGGRRLGAVRTDGKGRFTRTVRLPEVQSGDYTVIVKAGKKSASAKVSIGNPPGGPAALGVFTPGLPGDLSRLASFEKSIGRPVRVVMWYQAWTGGNQALDIGQVAAIAARGATPMITWEPFDPVGGTVQPIFQLRNLCSLPGSLTPSPYDPYIDDWATKLAGWGGPVLLRFAHEMNGAWYPWSEQINGNLPGDYVTAWNCLRARFLARGAVNVQWVWSPNVDFPGATPYAQVFPGDGAVDWVAIDGYNWGAANPSQGGWKSFSQLFGPSIRLADTLSDRPLMIGETASAEQGGSKAAWITDAMLEQIPLAFPQIRALIWFNVDKEADWRIGSSRSAREAFAAAAAHPYWKATLPAASHGWPATGEAGASRERDDRRARPGRGGARGGGQDAAPDR
ncbi:MAG: glycoside hydrolase family 26 protein [Chloroflexota bacterium]